MMSPLRFVARGLVVGLLAAGICAGALFAYVAWVSEADEVVGQRYELARFTTPILAAEPGRVQNITMAAKKISGVVIQPGRTFSFNEVVGPRNAAHGWAQAKELYQGEFVLGYGGGICQVSSTLYNAVLLGGLTVTERYHHDRPLQYVDPGRDATVAWNQLDFQFLNSTDQPLQLVAQVIPGAPQEVEVRLYASEPVAKGSIYLEDGEIRYTPPDLIEVVDPSLPVDARTVIDEGYYGIEVKIFRVFHEGGQGRRELVSHDRYLPKAGKVLVGAAKADGGERQPGPGPR